MRNYKTQLEYVLHASELSVLLSRAGELFSTLPRGHAIVSDVNGGEFYGYTNSGTPTDKTYEDAKRELEKETYAYTGDPIIPLEGQF